MCLDCIEDAESKTHYLVRPSVLLNLPPVFCLLCPLSCVSRYHLIAVHQSYLCSSPSRYLPFLPHLFLFFPVFPSSLPRLLLISFSPLPSLSIFSLSSSSSLPFLSFLCRQILRHRLRYRENMEIFAVVKVRLPTLSNVTMSSVSLYECDV